MLHIPRKHLVDPDVDHQVVIHPDSFDTGGEIGSVITPNLVWKISSKPGRRPWFLRQPCPTAKVQLAMEMHHPDEAAL